MNDINVKLVSPKPAADLDPLFKALVKKNEDPVAIEAPRSIEENASSNDAVEAVAVTEGLSYEVVSLNIAKDDSMDVDESPKEVNIPIVVEIAEEEEIDENDAVSNAVAALTADNITAPPHLNGNNPATLETEELLNVLETETVNTAQEETKTDLSLLNNKQNTSPNNLDIKDDIPIDSNIKDTDIDRTHNVDTASIEIRQLNTTVTADSEIKPEITINTSSAEAELIEDKKDIYTDLEQAVPVLETKVLETEVNEPEKVVLKEPVITPKEDLELVTEMQKKSNNPIDTPTMVDTINKSQSPINDQSNSKSSCPDIDTKTSIDALMANFRGKPAIKQIDTKTSIDALMENFKGKPAIKLSDTKTPIDVLMANIKNRPNIKLNRPAISIKDKHTELLSLINKADSIMEVETEALSIHAIGKETDTVAIHAETKAVDDKSPSTIQDLAVEVVPEDKDSSNDKDTDTEMVEAGVEKVEKKGAIKVVKPEALGQPVNGDVAKDEHSIKRRPSDDLETESPLKKLCQEVEKTFPQHDSMINEYIQTATKNNIDEIQKHTEQLLAEIQTLRELAQKKEHEWNNILHLKKVKEEILLRLLRRKQVISFEKSPEVNGSSSDRKDPFEYLNQAKNLAIDKSDEISGLALRQPVAPSPPINQNQGAMNQGSMNQGSMNQGSMNQGSMNQGSMNQGSMNQGSMNQGPMIQPSMIPGHFNTMTGLPPPYDKVPMQGMPNMQNMPKNMFPQSLMMPGPTMQGFPRDMNLNGNMAQNYMPMGRQGPTKDVKSIIADYRQRNPDVTPRRGRRMKSLLNPNMMNAQGPRQIAPKLDNLGNLGMIFNNLDMNQKAMLERLSQMQGASLPNGMSFKDVLVQFASMQQQGMMPIRPDMMPGRAEQPCRMEPPSRPEPPPTRPDPPRPSRRPERTPQQHHEEVQISMKSERVASSSPRLPPPPPYPEISLLPVNQETPGSNSQQNSLLHGILTKNCGEITITPVQPAAAAPEATPQEKPEEIVQLDDEESPASEGSTEEVSTGSGRLVIDEASGEAETPLCQGCRRRDAQFVCAGCANQWYCSRDCQVAAWDEHSEMCSG